MVGLAENTLLKVLRRYNLRLGALQLLYMDGSLDLPMPAIYFYGTFNN